MIQAAHTVSLRSGRETVATAVLTFLNTHKDHRIVSVVPTVMFYDGDCPRKYRVAVIVIIAEVL